MEPLKLSRPDQHYRFPTVNSPPPISYTTMAMKRKLEVDSEDVSPVVCLCDTSAHHSPLNSISCAANKATETRPISQHACRHRRYDDRL